MPEVKVLTRNDGKRMSEFYAAHLYRVTDKDQIGLLLLESAFILLREVSRIVRLVILSL